MKLASLFLRLITQNVRYAADDREQGEKPWDVRAPLLIDELRTITTGHAQSIMCMQEVLHNQLLDITKGLNHVNTSADSSADSCGRAADVGEWTHIGIGRDGGQEGEYSPIFFRAGVWEVEDWDTKWLSETPDKPSTGWDAASPRIVTIGRFRHLETDQKVVGLCTHLDDQGQKARKKGVELILEQAEKWSGKEQLPMFLAGDFNSKPGGGAYKTVANNTDSPLQDSRDLASHITGPDETYTGFHEDHEKWEIDFIFVGPREKQPWKVGEYAVLDNIKDGVYMSDHRTVMADLRL